MRSGAWVIGVCVGLPNVQAFLPRLKLEESYALESFLCSSRMTGVFEKAKPDFPGMFTTKHHPSLHTAVGGGQRGRQRSAPVLSFPLSIRRRKTSSISFCGRFSSPERGLLQTVLGICEMSKPILYGLFLKFVKCSRPSIMDALSEANGAFALRLLKILCQDDPSRNVFYSPVSISSALAMVFLGAKGDTAAQLAQVLSLNTEKDIHEDFRALLTELNKPGTQYLLRTASRLFGEKTCEFLSIFKEACLWFYHTELEQLSFAKAAEPSRKRINAWVSKKTEGKIPELLPGNSIDEQTRLVLINTVYFKGRWNEQFNEAYTREMPFRVNQVGEAFEHPENLMKKLNGKINFKEQRPVQMMFQEGTFRLAHIEEVQAQVLELPYAGEELSMVILLPDDHVALSSVEKHLTFEKFLAWTHPDCMKSTEVEVFLPRFKLEEAYDLGSVLQGLGVVDAFQQGGADFSAMSADSDLCLSRFAHKSLVEVNEEGTEAAAALAVTVVECCMESGPRFCADRPFLFFIRHNKASSILFCGRLSSP
eukprot:bmy_21676T0